MSRPTGSNPPPAGFAAALIDALEEAQAAASQAKPSPQLAQAAWQKLQFDFPVVSQAELTALAGEYSSSARRQVNPRFLAVLREHSGAAATSVDAPTAADSGAAASSSTAPCGTTAASPLVPLYQQLYASAVLGSLRAALEAPEAAAAAQLAAALPQAAAPSTVAEGASRMEEALAAAVPVDRSELEHRDSQQADDNSFEYEPLEPAAPIWQPPPLASQQQQQEQAAMARAGSHVSCQALPDQLAELAGHLTYHCMSDVAAWRELRLMQRLADCLAAARRHARFAELQAVAQPLLQLATDRMVAAPLELEAGLPVLLGALGIPSSSGSATGSTTTSQLDAAAAAAAGELALAAVVTLAAQVASPSARRRLWQEVHECLLPVAALQLEQQQVQLARQARTAARAASGAAGGAAGSQPTPRQLYSVMLPCQLLYFYVLQAPPAMATAAAAAGGSGSRLSDALLQGGLLRSLVLLFVQLGGTSGAEPLRCALLLACAAAQSLADWAAAVPGFVASTAVPELGIGGEAELHGALWQVLLCGNGGTLAALLGGGAPAEKVPVVYTALQLMADVQAVARRPLWGGDVEAALRALSDTLRRKHGRSSEADAGAAGSSAAAGGEALSEEKEEEEEADAGDAKKLAVGAAEAAAVATARRARQLQPACLKLVKDLLQRQGGLGSGKHD